MNRKAIMVVLLAGWIVLILGVMMLPAFGTFPERGNGIQSVAVYYLEKGVVQTGALNIVSTIVWEYRSYDTLGEVTILFTAVCGVLLVLRREGIS